MFIYTGPHRILNIHQECREQGCFFFCITSIPLPSAFLNICIQIRFPTLPSNFLRHLPMSTWVIWARNYTRPSSFNKAMWLSCPAVLQNNKYGDLRFCSFSSGQLFRWGVLREVQPPRCISSFLRARNLVIRYLQIGSKIWVVYFKYCF